MLILSICFVATLSAQEKDFLLRKNEVKLNIPVSIFGAFPEVSYERILAEDISVGAALGVSVDGGDTYGYKYQFSPYFRWFFGGDRESARKYAAGLFIEANASVYSVEEDKHYVGADRTDFESGAGLGIGLGWKYVSKNNWVGEILFGIGKDMSGNDIDVYPRFGISIGKRF